MPSILRLPRLLHDNAVVFASLLIIKDYTENYYLLSGLPRLLRKI